MIRLLLIPFSLLLNILPLSFSQALARASADLFRLVIGFRRKVMLDGLETAFGNTLSENERQRLVKENYRHYALVMLEIVRSILWSKERMIREVEVEGYEHLHNLAAGGGGFVLTSHLGNWEYSILAASARGLPCDIVVKKSKTPVVESFLQWFRRRYGAGILHESYTAKEILYSVTHGRVVAIILDQFMGPPIGLPVTFFGKRAGTAVALSLFVEKKDVPVVAAYNYRDSNGRIRVVIEPPMKLDRLEGQKGENLYKMTQLFNDTIERHVRRYPAHWLWLHRRWKPFRGEPRWVLKPAHTILASLLWLLVNSCSSKSATPTGIALPPDPTIAVPNFKTEDAETVVGAPNTTPFPTPLPSPTVSLKGKVKKKKETNMNIASPSPTATPTSAPLASSVPQTLNSVAIIPVDRIPFEVGERLSIDLNWTALPAGRAIIEVREGPKFNGRDTYHLWGNVLSSKLVDTIYHVDNTIESFVDREGLLPYKFLLHMVESKQLKETRVAFDHVNQKAHYWAKRISERWGNQDIDRQDALVTQSKDMFSALYFARSMNYTMGKTQIVPVYENGQNWNIEVTPVAYEFVNSGVGAFQCWKVKVTAKLNNVLSPTGDMYLWLSDDSKKYPVKFDAKIKIGSLLGSLTSIKEH